MKLRASTTTVLTHDVLFNLFAAIVGAVPPLQAVLFLHKKNHPTLLRRSNLSFSDHKQAKRTFAYLLKHDYITFEQKDGTIVLQLTPKGKKKAALKAFQESLETMVHTSRRVWDGKWCLILFDIPTEDRVKRNAFRAFIKQLGAVMIQKSVWAYPYDCAKEIQILADYFDLSASELRIVIANDIGSDESLRKHFKL